MKQIYSLLVVALFFAGCKKENDAPVTGTVRLVTNCSPDFFLVELDAPDHSSMPFLCDPMSASLSSSSLNCGNSVYIELPSSLRNDGQRIKFSEWTDLGLFCSSSTFSSRYLEVKNVSPN